MAYSGLRNRRRDLCAPTVVDIDRIGVVLFEPGSKLVGVLEDLLGGSRPVAPVRLRPPGTAVRSRRGYFDRAGRTSRTIALPLPGGDPQRLAGHRSALQRL